jgi:hypothetical protein
MGNPVIYQITIKMDKYGKTKKANETLLSQQKPQEKQSQQPPSSGIIVLQDNDL